VVSSNVVVYLVTNNKLDERIINNNINIILVAYS
jgi:hypothetical protein